MKKMILITLFSVALTACSSAENTNIANKNTNINANQNTMIQKITNQIKEPNNKHLNDLNAVQKEIEQGVSNSANKKPTTNSVKDQLHESQHAPETR
ncbi:MAG TPA: membrane lipoprotein lipid attachment site-containing protein [Pyrinomonadaceae bacterium]|nr:membrane lipoprotein lipid attachment site-containing protein [Pyrinomonadaceae bacterium]